MARTVWAGNTGTLRFADTQGALSSAADFACQVTSATVNTVPKTNTVPATYCAGETSIPGLSGFELAVAWLQDWNVSGGGLSKYLYDNETELKWFEYIPEDGLLSGAIGQCYLTPGPYGGEAGGGPFVASVTMGCPNKPTITVPA